MKMPEEVSLSSFFRENEALDQYQGGFRRDKLLEPWDDVCLMIMKYLMLEGRHGVYYFYHLSLLNHFYNREFVSIPFFLFHALEDSVIDVKEKKKKGANFTILHQGIMFGLFQFHLALFPPRVISINNIPPLRLEFTSGSQGSTPQPSPSQTPAKGRKDKILTLELKPNKRFKMDKRWEVDIGHSDEEISGDRRRLGRIFKNRGRYKKMVRHSQEEEEDDTNFGESDKNLGDSMDKGKEEIDKDVEK